MAASLYNSPVTATDVCRHPARRSRGASPLKTFFPAAHARRVASGLVYLNLLVYARQAVLSEPQTAAVLTPRRTAAKSAGDILLDFGVEVAGSVELFTPLAGDRGGEPRVRVRFGESVSEAMPD